MRPHSKPDQQGEGKHGNFHPRIPPGGQRSGPTVRRRRLDGSFTAEEPLTVLIFLLLCARRLSTHQNNSPPAGRPAALWEAEQVLTKTPFPPRSRLSTLFLERPGSTVGFCSEVLVQLRFNL